MVPVTRNNPPISWYEVISRISDLLTQVAANKLLSREVTEYLSRNSDIGARDHQSNDEYPGVARKVLKTTHERLPDLANDPFFGFLLGALDITAVGCVDATVDKVVSFPGTNDTDEARGCYLTGRSLGKITSDVRLSAARDSRAPVVPTPFMSLFDMLESIPGPGHACDCQTLYADFGLQIEKLYTNGYVGRAFNTPNSSTKFHGDNGSGVLRRQTS